MILPKGNLEYAKDWRGFKYFIPPYIINDPYEFLIDENENRNIVVKLKFKSIKESFVSINNNATIKDLKVQ